MTLKDFYQDKALFNDFKAYLNKFIELKAIEKVFEREDTLAVAEAKDLIDGAFEQMEVEFAPKHKKRDLNNAI